MNKLALGVDLSSQLDFSSDKARQVSAIASLETGSKPFSEILSHQKNKADKTRNVANENGSDSRVTRHKNDHVEHAKQAESSRIESKDVRGESRKSEQVSNEKAEVRKDKTNDSSSSEGAAKSSESNTSGHKGDRVAGESQSTGTESTEKPAQEAVEDPSSEDALVRYNEQAEVSSDTVAVALQGGPTGPQELTTQLNVGADTNSVLSLDDTGVLTGESDVASSVLPGLVDGDVAQTVELNAAQAIVGNVSTEENGLIPSDVGALSEGLNSTGLSSETVSTVASQIPGANTTVDGDPLISGQLNTAAIDEVLSGADELVPEKIADLAASSQSSVVTGAGTVAGPSVPVGDVAGIEGIEPDLLQSKGNSETRPAHLSLGNAITTTAGSASGQSDQQMGQQGREGNSAMLLKGLENASMKSSALAEKMVGGEKFGSLLSQQLEGLDARMTQATIDSKSSLSQLREVPGLRNYATTIPLPMNNAEWGEEFSSKVAWLVNQRIQSAEIHVNPQELGPIEIKINMQNDQANVVINSQHASVRDLLELNVHRLRDMMDGAGVGLGDVDVSDQENQQQFAGDQEEGSGVAEGASMDEGEDSVSAETTTVQMGPVGLVDYYA